MRTAKERPPVKLPWATPASTAHPLHSHPIDHTPTITVNQEKQTKRLASTASPTKLHSPMQPQTSKSLQCKSTYAHPSKPQQQTHTHISHLLITS
eukprot:35326-Ditylum_brightwellii.AAC.1